MLQGCIFSKLLTSIILIGNPAGTSSLTQNGKYLVFCDEVPTAIPIHLVDVTNFENIQPVSSFLPYPLTTPHNPYILGNDWAIVSCYDDGLHIYDISDPANNTNIHDDDLKNFPQKNFEEIYYGVIQNLNYLN